MIVYRSRVFPVHILNLDGHMDQRHGRKDPLYPASNFITGTNESGHCSVFLMFVSRDTSDP